MLLETTNTVLVLEQIAKNLRNLIASKEVYISSPLQTNLHVMEELLK